jgi:hypothetical protein
MTGMATDKEQKTAEKTYVRVTPRSYLAAGFFLLFFSAFLFYLEYSLSGAVALGDRPGLVVDDAIVL